MSIDEHRLIIKLKQIQNQIDNQTSSLNELHKERKTVIVFCYANGLSAISIAEALNMTRQRVYKILEEHKEEEE
jgi:DNA-directed RNA polymerase specialized sigma subunit